MHTRRPGWVKSGGSGLDRRPSGLPSIADILPRRDELAVWATFGHQLSALIPKSKAAPRRLRNFNLVLVTGPHAGYTSAERPVSIGIVQPPMRGECMTKVKGPIISFADLPSIEAHLSAHEGSQSGFWLKLAKAGAPEATITKAQAIEAALCHGWIDGQLGKFDEIYFLVRMTPRRSASRWSAINRDTAERLIREGRMQPAGLSEVQKAKANGRWSAAYQSQGKAEPPADFLAALAANAEAERAFATLDRANRYAFVYRVNDAKRPETRNKRIRAFVEMLARGETIHPTKSKRAPRA